MPTCLAKPTTPRVQPAHPLAAGLKFFLPAHGPADVAVARECVGNLAMTATNGARTGQGGILCDATGKGFEATLPASLRLTLPITVACQVRVLGVMSAGGKFFGMVPNNTDSSPNLCAAIYIDGSTFLTLGTNSNGAANELKSTVTSGSRVGSRDILAGVLTSTSRALYLNGVAIASSSGAYLNPTYGATALVAAGNHAGIGRNSNCVVEGGAIWNRALSLLEIRTLSADFFAPVRPRSSLAVLAAALSPAASIVARRGRSFRVGSRGVA